MEGLNVCGVISRISKRVLVDLDVDFSWELISSENIYKMKENQTGGWFWFLYFMLHGLSNTKTILIENQLWYWRDRGDSHLSKGY